MMKRTLLPLTLCLLAAPAAASPELAELWGAKAVALSSRSSALLEAAREGQMPALDEDYVIEMERFALNATRLAAWSEASDAPTGLSCTFRSLGQETETELETLETARTARSVETALARLLALLENAEDLSTAAAWVGRHGPGAPVAAHLPDTCPAPPGPLNKLAAR